MTQRTFETSDGVGLIYQDLGSVSAMPVVLCHGLAAAGLQFEADAAHFVRKGYRVLVPDLRGHGLSGVPITMRDEDFSITRMARDLVEMLDDAGVESVNWVGNSLGGILALSLVGTDPRRLASLATFGTAYTLDLPPFLPHMLPLVYAALGPGLTAAITARTTSRNVEAQELVASILREFSPRAGKAVGANVRKYDLIANARAYEAPILLIRCGLDHAVNRALPRTLDAMADRLNFTLADIPEGGHCANLDAPEKLYAILENFWRHHGLAAKTVPGMAGA